MSYRPHLPPLARSLSAKLLVLTIFFVMLSEVLIYAPSAGRFRLTYLQGHLAAGHLALLALQATPDHMVSEHLESELMHHAGAYVIGLRRPDGTRLMLEPPTPLPPVDATFDLREASFFSLIGDAFATLAQRENRLLRVIGPSPKLPRTTIEIVIDEWPMRAALIDYSYRIMGLSIVISLITAALVYLSLQWLLVRPMRRMTESMVAFRQAPEDASRMPPPNQRASRRTDEIGVAQRELAEMQAGLRGALQQKARLAALGVAVTKINHDLRSILATARLVSDRLADSEDPEVRRTTPTLMTAIDRAVELCSKTLDFTREGPPRLTYGRFRLAALVEEAGAVVLSAQPGREAVWHNAVPADLMIEADRDQLFRVLVNLGQNAVQAGATRIAVAAKRPGNHVEGDHVEIEVADNGPGLPPRARERLFEPFAGSARPGGSGLGLAIARELMRAHGGDIRLAESTAGGTTFRLDLPLRASDRQIPSPAPAGEGGTRETGG